MSSLLQGYYDSFDAGVMDENGYITIHGRIDDVIQVAGHRLSTKQMEMVSSMQFFADESAHKTNYLGTWLELPFASSL